jgi:hypothetical protein
LSHILVGQYVESIEFDIQFIQNGDQSPTEATTRGFGRALHKHHYWRSVDQSLQFVLNIIRFNVWRTRYQRTEFERVLFDFIDEFLHIRAFDAFNFFLI